MQVSLLAGDSTCNPTSGSIKRMRKLAAFLHEQLTGDHVSSWMHELTAATDEWETYQGGLTKQGIAELRQMGISSCER